MQVYNHYTVQKCDIAAWSGPARHRTAVC